MIGPHGTPLVFFTLTQEKDQSQNFYKMHGPMSKGKNAGINFKI